MLLLNIETNQSAIRSLNDIFNMIANLAYTKLPIEGTNLFRKLASYKNKHYKRIIERLIYISLIILNLSSLISSYPVVKFLVNIIAASKRLKNNKAITLFDYTGIIGFASSALEWVLINSGKHKISTYLPNVDTVVKASLLGSSINKKYLLIRNVQCLVTLYELEIRKDTYEVLILIRRDFGLYAYHAELLHSIKCEVKEDAKSKNVEEKSLISEIELDPDNISALHNLESTIKEEAEKEANSIVNVSHITQTLDQQYKESLTINNENILPKLFFNHFQFSPISSNEGKADAVILNETP
jgi:hypothetical protein